MRICVVSPSRGALTETFIQAQILGLDAEPIYGDWPYCEVEGREVLKAGERFLQEQLGRVARRGDGGLAVLAGKTGDWLRGRGIDRLAAWMKGKGIGAVVAEYGTTGAWLIPVCRAAGASLTVHFHGFDAFEKQTLKDYEAAYREVFASRARIVVVSREMEKQLISLGARAEQVFWNPCGVNLEQFRAADAGKNDPCFLAVGRFVEKKAPYLTLLAFARAAQEVPEARLEMVGDGPLRSVCEQMEAAMRSAGQLREGQVRFLGPRNSGEIAGLLRQARAFVQHSIRASNGDAEGTPVAILEAAATGLPVISTRHMGIPEAVVEGQTGWLGDELDVTAMAKAMIEAAQQPEEAARRGQQGREHIARNYNQPAQIEKLRRIAMEAPVP